MATSFLSHRLLSGRLRLSSPSLRLFSTSSTSSGSNSDTSTLSDNDTTFTAPAPAPAPESDPTPARQVRNFEPRPLEGGMDPGIYKAILVGKVGQAPIQRRLRSGRDIVLFSLATGGIRNNRRPLPHERPEDYESRSKVQWHRVCVYVERFIPMALNVVKPGAVLYLEGNLETKVFADPASGIVRRIREIAIRGDGGRLLYLGSDEEGPKLDKATASNVGYF